MATIAAQFKQIYAVKIIGPAAIHEDNDDNDTTTSTTTALAFDVQGTKTRWRVVRTPSDFSDLAQHYKTTSKIPALPSKPTPSSLGKWLTSVFWLFKGRRGKATTTPKQDETHLRNLTVFVNFLHPVQSDSVIKNRHSHGPGKSGDGDTDSLGRTTTSSDSTFNTMGRDSASNALGPTSALDDTSVPIATGRSLLEEENLLYYEPQQSQQQSQEEYFSSSSSTAFSPLPSPLPSSPRTAFPSTPTSAAAAASASSRRDSLDDTIANLIPQIVQQQMKKLKKETTDIQNALKIERTQHRNDRRSEQLLLQERYENLMQAAEKDRIALETKLEAYAKENQYLKNTIVTLSQDKKRIMLEIKEKNKATTSSTASNDEASQQNRVLLQENQRLQEEVAVHVAKRNKEEELMNECVRHGREIKSIHEARAREVTLRQVAENAVFEAESKSGGWWGGVWWRVVGNHCGKPVWETSVGSQCGKPVWEASVGSQWC